MMMMRCCVTMFCEMMIAVLVNNWFISLGVPVGSSYFDQNSRFLVRAIFVTVEHPH